MDEQTDPGRLALVPENGGPRPESRPALASTVPRSAAALGRELDWLAALIEARTTRYLQDTGPSPAMAEWGSPPELEGDCSFTHLLRRHELTPPERLLLILALAPHLRPQVLDTFMIQNPALGRGFTEFGGVRGQEHGGFLPTGETALFLLAGDDLSARLAHVPLFHREHALYRLNLLDFPRHSPGEPLWSAVLTPAPDLLGTLLDDPRGGPHFDARFPASRITTLMEWSDLILPSSVLEQVEELSAWIQHADLLMNGWGLKRVLRPGYRALFYGPSGTGKTLTTMLLGKREGLDVYRIDLSAVVSKYIGETEKNLAAVFDRATHQNWILFFDEAEALFGRRTQTSSAHDRYANQEVAYLLQRLEDYPGLVVLATNLKANIDEAFARRFESVVYFPKPEAPDRLRLWQTLLRSPPELEESIDLAQLARDHDLTGGQIVNVLRHAAVKAAMRDEAFLQRESVFAGIRREYLKEGKSADRE